MTPGAVGSGLKEQVYRRGGCRSHQRFGSTLTDGFRMQLLLVVVHMGFDEIFASHSWSVYLVFIVNNSDALVTPSPSSQIFLDAICAC